MIPGATQQLQTFWLALCGSARTRQAVVFGSRQRTKRWLATRVVLELVARFCWLCVDPCLAGQRRQSFAAQAAAHTSSEATASTPTDSAGLADAALAWLMLRLVCVHQT